MSGYPRFDLKHKTGLALLRLVQWTMLTMAWWTVIIACGSRMAQETMPPLATVPAVDLNRYVGKWYEIASYPAWFQKGCTGTTADYTPLPDGRIRVVNRCFKNSLDGPLKESSGSAEVADPITKAKLKVTFFWPFKGDYWIIGLDPDYRWAIVGVPSRRYLWILSRTPTLETAVIKDIFQIIEEKGFDPKRLQWSLQPK